MKSNVFDNMRHDLPASVVVFFVAVPLCLGIALASGAPLLSGLIAGIVGGIVVGAVSKSQLGVSGPAAGLAVIVLAAINDLGFEAFLAAVVIAGVLQIAFGLLRGGFIAHFFPSSVIKGMLAGIGVIIILKQIPHAVGHDTAPEGEFAFAQSDGQTTISTLGAMFGSLQMGAVIISCVSLPLLIFWEKVLAKKAKIFQYVQGPLVVVAFGILYQMITSQWFPGLALDPSHLVSVPVPGSISDLGSLMVFPDWSSLATAGVYVTACTLAIVASLETLLCVEATDKLDPQKRVTPTNRELVAQGVGNTLSGLIGGLPVTQVIVRSSANIQSGARTQLSAILHGVFLLFFVAVIPAVLNLIPLAVLASILLVVGYKLARPVLFKEMFSKGMSQFVPFVVTILGIVLTDLLLGIGLGMVCAIIVILRNNYVNSHFLHKEHIVSAEQRDRVRIRLAEEVTFLNRGAIVKSLSQIPDGAHVVIDVRGTVFIDQDVQEVIDDFQASSEARSITVEWVDSSSSEPAQAIAS